MNASGGGVGAGEGSKGLAINLLQLLPRALGRG